MSLSSPPEREGYRVEYREFAGGHTVPVEIVLHAFSLVTVAPART